MKRCLACYKPILEQGGDYHPSCSQQIFEQRKQPELSYGLDEMETLAEQVIRSRSAVTGAQAKISLDLQRRDNAESNSRFTIVGLWGRFILKPPASRYPNLPEVEDLTMHLASIAKIPCVPHSLIRLKSGELAYITRRIDRIKGEKLHMEDMCQLTEKFTEQKYHGSHEQVAKIINKYSDLPGLDMVNYYEQVLFSFLTGNADMHLKNFSMIQVPGIGFQLTPAYDMVNTVLVNPLDTEELALTLNGKKRKLKRADFVAVFQNAKLNDKQQANIFGKMEAALPKWREMIEISFLPHEFKDQYNEVLDTRFAALGLKTS